MGKIKKEVIKMEQKENQTLFDELLSHKRQIVELKPIIKTRIRDFISTIELDSDENIDFKKISNSATVNVLEYDTNSTILVHTFEELPKEAIEQIESEFNLDCNLIETIDKQWQNAYGTDIVKYTYWFNENWSVDKVLDR